MPCEFEANEKLISQVLSDATIPLNFYKVFYYLLPAVSLGILQSEFLESDILKVEVLLKHYLIPKWISFISGWSPSLKNAQGFSNSITLSGGGGMISFVRGEDCFMSWCESEKESVFYHSNLFQRTTICKYWSSIKIKIGLTCDLFIQSVRR